MRFVVKIGKKGVVVIPKALRELFNIKEDDEVVMEALNNSIIIKPIKPRVVDVDPSLAEKCYEERRRWVNRRV